MTRSALNEAEALKSPRPAGVGFAERLRSRDYYRFCPEITP